MTKEKVKTIKKTKSKRGRLEGRPGLLDNPELVEKLKYGFSIGCNITEACIFAEVSRDAFYAALKKDPEFSDKIEKLKLNAVIKAKKTVYDDLGNPQTARWYLEKKASHEFKSSQSVEITAPPQIIDDIK